MEGFFLLYDKVFNHEIIKNVLWSALTFDGLSFNHIRESLSFFMISSSLVILFVACIGFFTLRTNSKCLHVFVSNFYCVLTIDYYKRKLSSWKKICIIFFQHQVNIYYNAPFFLKWFPIYIIMRRKQIASQLMLRSFDRMS